MKHLKALSLVLILAVVLSACSTSATTTPVAEETLPMTTNTVEAVTTTTPDVGIGTESTTGTPSTDTGTPSADATGTVGVPVTGVDCADVTVQAANTTERGDFLVDCNGMTLYITTDDEANSGSSSCTGGCITQWPPLVVSDGETPMAGEGVDETLLGTITRDDGTLQVTYNGWPLYLYAGDSLPGETNGVGMGSWRLISPDGEPLE